MCTLQNAPVFQVSNLHTQLHVIECYVLYCLLYIYCSLGQAYKHIAALLLLLFIESHAGDEKLPSEALKTSKLMMRNQPPKKETSPACAQDMIFVKPTHSDVKPDNKIRCIK